MASPTTDPSSLWFKLSLDDVALRLGARESGLDSLQVKERRQRFGPNQLPEARPLTVWIVFARQFLSPLIYLLVIAALISVTIGDWKDALFIFGVLAINAVVGTYQEWKAEQSSRALKRLLSIRTVVIRDGHQIEIDAVELVPGDRVKLESGHRVPADIRLASSQDLKIDESLLTGESIAVEKLANWKPRGDEGLADQHNMAFAGSVVVRGRGQGWVVATGQHSQVGQLAHEVSSGSSGNPPLIERMERFTRVIAIGTLVISGLIGLLGWSLGRMMWDEVFLFVVALAVAAIPEGLPVAMTVALSIAASRMAKRRLVVRRLSAVEGLGSCTLIATDKTGTLTCNQLTARRVVLTDGSQWRVTGEGFAGEGSVEPIDTDTPQAREKLSRLGRAARLCNEGELRKNDDGWQYRGDPVDVALLALAHKLEAGQTQTELDDRVVDEIPFESDHKFAASLRQGPDGRRVYAKGAPEKIIEMCQLDEHQRTRAEQLSESLASDGLRVIALAEATVDALPEPGQGAGFGSLDLIGLVGMIDPLRAGVADAVDACHAAGVRVAMVTGDHPGTAFSIAKELRLATDPSQVITGRELEGFNSSQWDDIVRQYRVFSRVSPQQKLLLVQAAQRCGHFVAVTGDGVNDAPALKTANIGVAMGQAGTDVAREAAELVIADDNFATLVAGIEEGRIAYDNIRKVIYLLLSGGAAELAVVLFTIADGLPLPLLPVQLLWLNLVTNGIQGVAIAFEPGEPDILQRRPRQPTEPIFNRLMVERMLVGTLVMGGVGFLAFRDLLAAGWSVEAARNFLLLLMVLFENLHVGNCRSETQSAFRRTPWSSPMLLTGTLIAFGVHVLAMYTPGLNTLLGASSLDATGWALVVVLALSVVAGLELHKFSWWLRRSKRSPRDESGELPKA